MYDKYGEEGLKQGAGGGGGGGPFRSPEDIFAEVREGRFLYCEYEVGIVITFMGPIICSS